MARARLSLLLLATVAVAAVVVAAGCTVCPRPGFAGMPEQVNRSADFALPLSPGDLRALKLYLAMPVVTTGSLPEDLDPAEIEGAAAPYAALLAQLTLERPSVEDLRPAGSWARLFPEPDWPMTVHDARISEGSVDADRVRGLLCGKFVFAFYWRRLSHPTGGATREWLLEPEAPGFFTGLVVFPRQFALPTPAE